MGINRGFEEREAAEEARFVHGETKRHNQDIREVGIDGAKARELARQGRAIDPETVKASKSQGGHSRGGSSED